LFERTRRDRNRPLLQTDNPKARLEALLAERDPIYREVADMVVHTDDRSIKSVVKEIMVRLEQESKYQQR
ncbi:MAG: shikimate kinase, partial [Pseudomonadota bacterium]